MKHLAITTLVFFSMLLNASAQTAEDLKQQIDAAAKAAAAKNYKDVNFNLQQAMATLATVIGNEVLNVMPKEVNGLKSPSSDDRVNNGGMMFAAGSSIERSYRSADGAQSIEFKVMANSPMVATLGMMLSNPMYMQSAGNSGEKVISVGGKRALLKMDKDNKSAEIQIVSGSTLYTINANGMINTEADATAMVAKFDLAKIEALLN